jgi:PKD repeat protein
MKKLIIIFLILIAGLAQAQQTNVLLSGTVTDGPSGIPVPQQPVFISITTGNDSLLYITETVFTNDSGFYAYEFYLSGNTGLAAISTPDCDGTIMVQTFAISAGNAYTANFVICSNVPCLAQFTQFPDSSAAPFSFQFIDLSYGIVTAWAWDFGDGSTSAEANPYHQFPGEGEYTVCLTVSGPSCQSTWCELVSVGPAPGGCINYFTYQATGNTVLFAGFTGDGLPASYSWDFGDGSGGEGQQIMHTFPVTGTYYVSLNSVDSLGCSAWSSQTIAVGDTVIFSQVYGQVLAGNFPLSQGTVTIYSTDNIPGFPPYTATTPVDTSGIFIFPYIPAGSYVLYAVPGNTSGYMPGYYGDVMHWSEAQLVFSGNGGEMFLINLPPSRSATLTGTASISGVILTDPVAPQRVQEIKILVHNESLEPISFVPVSPEGYFYLEGLEPGTYYLYPELSGVNSSYMRIDILAIAPEVQVSMTFTGNAILGLEDEAAETGIGHPFPNPVADRLYIPTDLPAASSLRVTVYEITGRMIDDRMVSAPAGESEVVLPAGHWTPGIYFVSVLNPDTGVNTAWKIVRE